MIVTPSLLQNIINYQNQNILIRGTNIDILHNLLTDYNSQTEYHVTYKHKDNIYSIDTDSLTNKSELIELLTKICLSPDYFSDKIKKKVIILLHADLMNHLLLQRVNSLIDSSFMTSIFILHFTNNKLISPTISSRYLIVNSPNKDYNDKTIDITYNNIIKVAKQPLTSKSIESIRKICYMYYMNHANSLDLQKMIVEKIGSNLYLPNPIKSNVIDDITSINKLYGYSYRKPIFLECIIYSLFKHLEHYTYNL